MSDRKERQSGYYQGICGENQKIDSNHSHLVIYFMVIFKEDKISTTKNQATLKEDMILQEESELFEIWSAIRNGFRPDGIVDEEGKQIDNGKVIKSSTN